MEHSTSDASDNINVFNCKIRFFKYGTNIFIYRVLFRSSTMLIGEWYFLLSLHLFLFDNMAMQIHEFSTIIISYSFSYERHMELSIFF